MPADQERNGGPEQSKERFSDYLRKAQSSLTLLKDALRSGDSGKITEQLRDFAGRIAQAYGYAERTPTPDDDTQTLALEQEALAAIADEKIRQFLETLIVFFRSQKGMSRLSKLKEKFTKSIFGKLTKEAVAAEGALPGVVLATASLKDIAQNNPNLSAQSGEDVQKEYGVGFSDLKNSLSDVWITLADSSLGKPLKGTPGLERIQNVVEEAVEEMGQPYPESLPLQTTRALEGYLPILQQLRDRRIFQDGVSDPALNEKVVESHDAIRKVIAAIQWILHENMVIEMGRDKLKRPLFRPPRSGIDEKYYGEMMMFLGDVGGDVTEVEKMAILLANMRDDFKYPSLETYTDELRKIVSTKEHILKVKKNFIELRIGAGDEFEDADNEYLAGVFEEIGKYDEWLDRVETELKKHAPPEALDAGDAPVGGDVNEAIAIERKTRPNSEDVHGWEKWLQSFLERKPEIFVAYVRYIIDQVVRWDQNYDRQQPFKESPEAKEITRVKEFLILPGAVPEGHAKAAELKNLHEVLAAWIQYVDIMGPYGNSALGSVAYSKAVNVRYAEFGIHTMQKMLGTHPDVGSHWEFGQEALNVMIEVDRLMFESPSEPGLPLTLRKNPAPGEDEFKINEDIKAKGLFSYERSAWMGSKDSPYGELVNRLVAEGEAAKSGADIFWAIPGKNYRRIDLEAIQRIGYCTYLFGRGREERMTLPYAGGASPPKFYEYDDVLANYPLLKSMNLATKSIIELPEVCTGLEIDRNWLAKLARERGIFLAMRRKGEHKVERGNEIVWEEKPSMTNEERRFYEIGKKYSDAPYEDFNKDKLSNETIENIFWLIANDDELSDNEGYVRFRNLVRSIFVSEAKASQLGIKNIHKMKLVDEFGMEDPSHNGRFIAPMVTSPLLMLMGEHRDFFAEKDFRLHETFDPVFKAARDLHDHIAHTEPPKLKGGIGNHTADIEALWQDFEKCLGYTSPLKAAPELVNWDEIAELYEYRLRILIAAYRIAYPERDPAKRYDRDIVGETTGKKVVESLVDVFKKKIAESGQTLAGSSLVLTKENGVSKLIPLLLHHPYDHGKVNLKQRLIALIDVDAEGGKYSRTIYQRMLNGTSRIVVPFNEYDRLRSRWKVTKESMNNVLMPGGSGHSEAKRAQDDELSRSKADKK